jgi:two-component system chemotaxis sensor kinase CheA
MGTVEAKASPSGDLLTYLTEAVGFLQEGMAELAEGREPMIPAVHGISHLLEDGASALGVSLPDGEATLITEEMWAAATGGAGDSAEEEAAASTAEPAGEEERDATAEGAGPAPAKAGGEAAPAGPAVPKAAAPPSGSPPRSGARGGARSEGALRVGVDKLDELMNAIEEVVILEAMITQSPQLERLDTSFFDFKKMLKQLEKATHSLQDAAMSIRMVPLAGTFKKMIRLVRDVSRKTNKEAELVIRGEHTEIDKNVIESINDPLVHMIRNSIDHGLESVEERKQAGKPPVGSIRLEAEQVSGQVLIRVVDDGRGLDREKLLARAREKGVIEGDGSSLSDEQVWQLIFAPGFSTAAQVSDVSGRGVGMDVVRSNIEAIGGRVEISSRPGEGSTFTLRIPLTLAVMEGMIVGIGKSRYTIPINMVKETLRLQGAHVENTPEGYEVLKLRDDLIPVARLGRQLGKPRTAESDLYGVVVEDGTARLCLAVDDLVGKHQIVVKGLSEYLGDTRYVSGCTILGDGAVSPILDVPGTLDEFRRQIALAKKQQYRGAEEQLPAT